MKKVRYCLLVFFLSCAGCASFACEVEEVRSHFDIEVVLSKPLSFDAVEQEHIVNVRDEGIVKSVPFGHLNDEWQQMKSMYQDGDCLFFFRTEKGSWDAFHGREGYVLSRSGEPIHALITKMN